jgi:hypothetical protein
MTIKRELFLSLLLLMPFIQYGMESKKNPGISTNRLCFGLLTTTIGALSFYNQLHNEKYSWKRSFFTGSCLLTGLVSLFGKFNFVKIPKSSYTIETTSFTQDGRTTIFTRRTGDQPYTPENDPSIPSIRPIRPVRPITPMPPISPIWLEDEPTAFDLPNLSGLADLERRYAPLLQDMRPRSRRHRVPIQPVVPVTPVAPVAPIVPTPPRVPTFEIVFTYGRSN